MSETVTGTKLRHSVRQALGSDVLGSIDLVDQIFECISFCLASGESVRLSGSFNFEVRDKVARPGRNPRTLEPTLIEARRVVSCKAGQKLKARLAAIKVIPPLTA